MFSFPKQALVFTCLHFKSFENTVGKGEIARNECFLLFLPTVFSTVVENILPFSWNIKLSSANPFSLEESKICRLGKVKPIPKYCNVWYEGPLVSISSAAILVENFLFNSLFSLANISSSFDNLSTKWIMRILVLSCNVFFPITDRNHFSTTFIVCKCFDFGQVQIFVVW